MKLVAAIKMLPTPEQAACLTATLARCNEACTWLAGAGFDSQTFRQFDLHKLVYTDVRERFSLTAQAAVRSIAKVADAFKVSRKVAPVFRPDAAQPYDDRIIRFVKDGSAVSLWTIEGRITVPIVMGDHQKRLMAYRKGEVDLCHVRGKWMLAATCDIPETDEFKAADWLGVDFGIVSLAVDSDGATYSGADVERVRDRLARRKRGLLSSYGSVQGIIYSLIKEADKPNFRLRELATDHLVRCYYTTDQYPQVYTALRERSAVVHVSGNLTLDRITRTVTIMDVDRIDQAEALSGADFERFFGSSPLLTGDMETEEFIELARGNGE